MTGTFPKMVLPIVRLPRRRWPWLDNFWGFINNALIKFSRYYLRWRGITRTRGLGRIHYLPFNLLVKFCFNSADVEREARALMMARAMGLPVPRVIGYSSKGPEKDSHTILMTRIQGKPLSQVYDTYSEEGLDVIMAEVGACLDKMHAFASPYGPAICGLDGDLIENSVLPMRRFARSMNPLDFHDSINLWPPDYETENFDALAQMARQLNGKDYQVVFGHGDLAPWNIMVEDGHLTGIIDWEFAGWYPKYWDYVNPLACYGDNRDWAKDLSLRIPGSEQYPQEWQAWDALSILLACWVD